MNSFEGFTIEDLCNLEDEVFGGLQAKLYYAPASFFANIYIARKTLEIFPDDIEFKNSDLSWGVLDILIDENELKTSLVGGLQRKKSKSNLEIFILGLRLKVQNFIEQLKNEPLIFYISSTSGDGHLMGNLKNRAFIEQANSSSARRFEENAGCAASLTANAPLYFINKNEEENFKIFDQTFDQTF